MVGHVQLPSTELPHVAGPQESTEKGRIVPADTKTDEAIMGQKILEFKVLHGFLIAFFFWIL
jgi:hypothetical protein